MKESSGTTKDTKPEQCQSNLDGIISQIGFGRFNIIFVVICGSLHICDGMEMLLLAFLGPVLACAWQISVYEQSFLTTALFIGMLLGGPLIGKLCDVYGRKSFLLISATSLAYIGLLCAISPTIIWLIFGRAIIGIMLGGIMSSMSTLISETQPVKHRGTVMLMMQSFWPLGSFFITTLCLLVVPTLGWRWFVVFAAVPLLFCQCFIHWLPESPRFLLLHNRKPEALEVLNRIAKWNGHSVITDVSNPDQQPHSFRDLFHPNYRLVFVMTIIMWMLTGFCYFGSVMLITIINTISHTCLQNSSQFSVLPTKLIDDSCCKQLNWSSYIDTYISTAGELVFMLPLYILINCLGRKATLAINSFLATLMFVLLNFCMPRGYMKFILLVLRGSMISIFHVNYIYASEVYPTSVRSLGIGLCNGAARLGAMSAPFVVNLLIVQYSFLGGTIIFASCTFLLFLLSMSLPIETRGRMLYQTANDKIEVIPDVTHNEKTS